MQTAPSEVAIEFTEGVEPKFSAIEVHDSQGTRVDNGDAHAALDNTKRLAVSLKPLQPGTYNVTWRITSTDTHKTKGSYIFKVVQ
jgi:copper resistance protein C